jgi:integrase
MTGLRQGELIALRWKDVDWKAGLIRVRRNYTRGKFGTPKTKRSSGAVPMPGRVAAAIKEHFKKTGRRHADLSADEWQLLDMTVNGGGGGRPAPSTRSPR